MLLGCMGVARMIGNVFNEGEVFANDSNFLVCEVGEGEVLTLCAEKLSHQFWFICALDHIQDRQIDEQNHV